MIKLEHVVLPSSEQMEFVIEGMHNPTNSWDESDSGRCCDIHRDICEESLCETCSVVCIHPWAAGPNDLQRMQSYSNGGADIRKFMRMMPVMVRITAPLYWWNEFDMCKIGTTDIRCSIMHNVFERELTLEDFSCNQLFMDSKEVLEDVVILMNKYRAYFLERNEKNYLWQMIQLLPSSYNQTRNVMLNYEVLTNIYKPRKNDRLDEWQEFCKWIETLPYHELITSPVIQSRKVE